MNSLSMSLVSSVYTYTTEVSSAFHLKIDFSFRFQCELHHPCDAIADCVNMAPGFRCEPCPNGYDGNHANGYYAQSVTNEYRNQVCEDIDECVLGIADCGPNAECVNTVGSYDCSCHRGFHQNISVGCQPAIGVCPDGTFCDKNAVCKHAEGNRVTLNQQSVNYDHMIE